MEKRLTQILDLYYSQDGSEGFVHFFTHDEAEELAKYLIKNDVIALPYKLDLPKELWRHMFDDNKRAIAVKCKVGKITEYGFSLIHYVDGREWDYKYSSLGETVFYSQEAVEEMIKERKLNDWLDIEAVK